MPTYISFLNYTEQGIKNIKESPSRLDTVRNAFKEAGAELKSFYLLMGRYDAICIIEAPDEDVLARLMLTIGSKGNVRTETVRAFNETEFKRVVGSV